LSGNKSSRAIISFNFLFFFITAIFCNGCPSPHEGIINLPRVKFASKQRAAHSFRQVHISPPRDRACTDRGVLCRGCWRCFGPLTNSLSRPR